MFGEKESRKEEVGESVNKKKSTTSRRFVELLELLDCLDFLSSPPLIKSPLLCYNTKIFHTQIHAATRR